MNAKGRAKARPFLFRGFKSSHELFESHLGTLEREVMAVVWKAGEINVREACERLDSSVAYTTVMTTMDRLFKKRLLDRRKVGRAFVYTALGASIGNLSAPLAYSAIAVWCVTAVIGAFAARHGYRRWRGRAAPEETAPSD